MIKYKIISYKNKLEKKWSVGFCLGRHDDLSNIEFYNKDWRKEYYQYAFRLKRSEILQTNWNKNISYDHI